MLTLGHVQHLYQARSTLFGRHDEVPNERSTHECNESTRMSIGLCVAHEAWNSLKPDEQPVLYRTDSFMRAFTWRTTLKLLLKLLPEVLNGNTQESGVKGTVKSSLTALCCGSPNIGTDQPGQCHRNDHKQHVHCLDDVAKDGATWSVSRKRPQTACPLLL